MSEVDDTRTRRNVAVLVAAQAFLGAQMPMIFVVGDTNLNGYHVPKTVFKSEF